MDRLTSHLTYANVVSTICLFLALGGAAWAAKTELAKNSVGTPQLKNGAVTGAKVKDGSLTGADIQSSTLGQVPSAASANIANSASHAGTADSATHATSADTAGHATSADTATRAGDANTLDGLGPSAFYPAGGVTRIDAAPAFNAAEPTTLYSAHGLVLTATCSNPAEPLLTQLVIAASSTEPEALMSVGMFERYGSNTVPIAHEIPLSSFTEPVFEVVGAHHGNAGQGVGTLVFTDRDLAVDFTLEMRVTPEQECQLSGTAAVSG